MENKLRILLADTNEDFADTLRACAQRRGDAEIIAAARTGREVLELCRTLRPDVLLLELILPELDGLGVLKRLEELEQRPAAILLTNFVTPLSVSMALEYGAAYYLSKPCEPEMVLDRVYAFASHVPSQISSRNQQSESVQEITEQVIAELLRELGVPAQIKGYLYLREAISVTVDDGGELQMVTKCLYPAIAKHHGTTASRVERAIRHAIELSWCRGNEEALRACFGHSVSANDRPTNSQYIATVSECLLMQRRSRMA